MGGTKIEVLVINELGKEFFRRRIETPQNNYDATLNAIAELIACAEQHVNQECSIGICTPGSLSPATDLLRNSNSICLNEKPFKIDLETLIGRKTRITNDANCFALSEATDGAASFGSIVFGVIIGTGTGGGIVVDKKVLLGKNAISGEWGHNPLPWPDENELGLTTCWCGQQGCIETFLSGPGLENEYRRVTKNSISAQEVVQLALNNDTQAEEVLCKYEQRMAKSLAHIINIIDPDIIVLGGGMSNVKRIYENVPKLWEKWIFSDVVNTELVAPKYGDSSGVRGAAWLWDH